MTTQDVTELTISERISGTSAGCDSPAHRYWIGNYRHLSPWPKGNLYLTVRKLLRLSQAQAAAAFGCSLSAWQYRETCKRSLKVAEVLALWEFSGLTADNYLKLLKEVA